MAGDSFLWRSAIGVSLVGLVPTACLLLSRKSFTPPRQPLGWLGAFLVMAVMMNLTSDGTGIGHVVIRLGGAGPFTFALADHTIVLMSLLDALWLTGLLVGLVALVWLREPLVGLCVLGGIGGGVAAAAVLGLTVPYVLHLLQRDPRVAAGPIALATTDMVTLLIYFNLARGLLG